MKYNEAFKVLCHSMNLKKANKCTSIVAICIFVAYIISIIIKDGLTVLKI